MAAASCAMVEAAPAEGGVFFYSEEGDTDRFGELSLPEAVTVADEALPVIVLIHGGFWQSTFELDLMTPLVSSLTERGFAVWNIEYHRVGQTGGGYPGTLHDVASAVDYLSTLGDDLPLDLSDVTIVGHSAGGHLGLWAASRGSLPAEAPGADPVIEPSLVIGQAAVTDLFDAAQQGLGRFAVQSFIGAEPHQNEGAYRIAQPIVGAVPTVLVHGDLDFVVPIDQSTRHEELAAVDVVVVEGEDHFAALDPTSRSWAAVLEAVESRS